MSSDNRAERRPKRKRHDFICALHRLHKGLPVSRWNNRWHWGKDTVELRSGADSGHELVYRAYELRKYALRDSSSVDLIEFDISNNDLFAQDWCIPVKLTKSDLRVNR